MLLAIFVGLYKVSLPKSKSGISVVNCQGTALNCTTAAAVKLGLVVFSATIQFKCIKLSVKTGCTPALCCLPVWLNTGECE